MTSSPIETATRSVPIGFAAPRCASGDRINLKGRNTLAAEPEAGALNAGNVRTSIPHPDETEPRPMRRMIDVSPALVDMPLCIDSSVRAALETCQAAAHG